MAGLHLSLFGGFSVSRDGEPLKGFVSDKARLLLAYLAVENARAHRRESLAGLFWPEKPAAQAHHSLSQALTTIKKQFQLQSEETCLDLTPQEVRFCSENAWLDVREFEELILACERQAHGSVPVCPDCLERLERAAALYLGDFLAGISLSRCQAFEEWLLEKQEYYRHQMVQAAGWCSKGFETQGDLEKALHYAYRQSALDHFDESAHRQVMHSLFLMGKRAEALAHYATCEKILKDELGISPSTETTALYLQIHSLSDQPDGPTASPNNLPVSLAHMVGRQVELGQLRQKLLDPNCRLLTVLGAGGAGKTCLALEAGRAVLPFFPDGVFLAELDTQGSSLSLLPVIAQTLEMDLRSEPGRHMGERLGIMDQLCSFMQRKRILLILDGFEGMLNEGVQVGEILRRLPDLKVMVTSRSRLNLAMEQVFLLEGLAYPAESAGEDLGAYGAVQLFVEAARNADPSFELDEGNRQAVAEICRLNQGIPLGILLAAAWVNTLSLHQIVKEIQRNLDFLRTDWRDLPERQRSLRATFDYSWRLLDSTGKAVFLNLSVLRGSFTPKVAEQVVGATLENLKTLVEQSLLQRHRSGNLRMHDLLRQYAQEKLRLMPAENQEIHLRHSQIYLERLAACERRLKSVEQPAVLAEIDQELPDILAAWEWAVTNGQVELLEKALDTLWYYHGLRGLFLEGAALYEMSRKDLETGELTGTNIRLWLQLGIRSVFAFWNRNEFDQARLVLSQIDGELEKWQGSLSGLRRELALLRLSKGDVILFGGGDRRSALQHYLDGLEMVSALENPWEISLALLKLAIGHDQAGNRFTSGRYAEQALAIQETIGDPNLLSAIWANLGYFYMLTGDYEGGLRAAQEEIMILRQNGHRLDQVNILYYLAIARFYAGQYAHARTLFQKAIEALIPTPEIGYRLFCRYIMAAIDLHTGEYTAVLNGAAFAGEPIGDYYEAAHGLYMGEVFLLTADWEQAEPELRRYLEQSMSLPRLDMVGQPLAMLGYIAYRKGDLPVALHYQEQALQNGLEYGFFWVFMLALSVLALILAESGSLEEAIALYATVTAHPCAVNSKWFEDLFGKPLAELTASLPAESRTMAQKGGQGRKLRETGEVCLAGLRETPGSLEGLRKKLSTERS